MPGKLQRNVCAKKNRKQKPGNTMPGKRSSGMMVKPCGGPMWGTGGTRCDRRESVGRGSSCWGDGP